MNNFNETDSLKKDEQAAEAAGSAGNVANQGAAFAGIGLILVGVIFIAMQVFGEQKWFGGNSWLIWMLIPVAAVLGAGYMQYKRSGNHLTRRVIIMLMWGLFPFVMMGLTFGLGISWGAMWPLALVLVGVTMLLGRE